MFLSAQEKKVGFSLRFKAIFIASMEFNYGSLCCKLKSLTEDFDQILNNRMLAPYSIIGFFFFFAKLFCFCFCRPLGPQANKLGANNMLEVTKKLNELAYRVHNLRLEFWPFFLFVFFVLFVFLFLFLSPLVS